METKTENKEQQEWKQEPISSSSSSRSSSITSDSSDGHFVIRHFPLPKPLLSASEAQKQRETHQAYSSYTSSSWSSSVHQNNVNDLPGYDPNRIPSSVFSSKPSNSTDWSIASNESLFSIHEGNFTNLGNSREETVHEITEINSVPHPLPLPPVSKPKESEKVMITKKKPDEEEEKSESKIDYDEIIKENMIEIQSDEEEEEIKTEKPGEKEIVEDVKENKQEDSISIVSHSPSVSCRSDTSNNSISSFVYPLLKKEDGVIKTPVMEIRKSVSYKQRPEYLVPQSPMQSSQPQPHHCSESAEQPHSQPQQKASKQFESKTQSQKSSKSGWFSCFQLRSKFGLLK